MKSSVFDLIPRFIPQFSLTVSEVCHVGGPLVYFCHRKLPKNAAVD